MVIEGFYFFRSGWSFHFLGLRRDGKQLAIAANWEWVGFVCNAGTDTLLELVSN